MGIQITQAVSKPAVTYDRVHMTKMEIIQPTFDDDGQIPKYQVVIHYRHYGTVDNVRYYKDEELQRVNLDDFIVVAMQKAQGGDMSLMNALTSIETAVAGIIADQTGIPTQVV